MYRLGSSRAREATAMAPARWMAVSWGYFCSAVMTHSMAPLVTSLRVLPLWTCEGKGKGGGEGEEMYDWMFE